MNLAFQNDSLTVEDYLAGEQESEVRHEYIGGMAYAMAGGNDEHNQIAGSFYAALRGHLRGRPCRVFMADVKVRLVLSGHDIFYYPDVLVTCDSRDTDPYSKRFPKVLIEVVSESTERIDRPEKLERYTQIESVEECVLAAQDKMEVTVFRRAQKWAAEVLRAPEQHARLNSLDFALRLQDIYEGLFHA